jgi:protein-tyrosine-phosphatase
MPDLDPVTQRRLNDMTDELVRELSASFDAQVIRDLMADSAARLARTAVVSDYLPALASRLTRERLLANVRAESDERVRSDVVFVSLSGVGRGQLAAALTSRLAGDRVTVHSAGTTPQAAIDPAVATAISELGIDVSEAYARPVTPEVLRATDVVVTMGHSVGTIEIPQGVRHEDWRVGDPTGAPLDEVRRVREDIERRVRALLDSLGIEPL